MRIDILIDEIELRVEEDPYVYGQLNFADKKH